MLNMIVGYRSFNVGYKIWRNGSMFIYKFVYIGVYIIIIDNSLKR